jgi:transcriptional regulator with GAF, ATPase, and Fis domain
VDQQRAQIIGHSPALRDVLARANRVAKADISVLIQGENGTGKELLAQRIHEGSSRAKKPFEIVNCAAIPKELLESKLFGHKKGAFTGAVDDKPGAFVRADGGTLFLDEIGELAPEHQAKILRAIHEGEVQAVGATETKHVDVRVIAATNRNLRERVASGAFREDLFHRLAGYELHLPALRERGTDVIEIAKALLESEATDKKERFLSRDAQALLLRHSWPGNVRELKNVVRAALIDCRGKRIAAKVLRRNRAFDAVAAQVPAASEPAGQRLEAVRELLATRGRVTPMDIRALFGVKKTRAFQLLEAWERAGAIVGRGAGRGAHYVAPSR